MSAEYERVRDKLSNLTYRGLRKRRNRLTEDIASGYYYSRVAYYVRGAPTVRVRQNDLLMVAWVNAEMNRRIWADPLVNAKAKRGKRK